MLIYNSCVLKADRLDDAISKKCRSIECLSCDGYTMAVAMVPKFDIGYASHLHIYISTSNQSFSIIYKLSVSPFTVSETNLIQNCGIFIYLFIYLLSFI